MPNQIVRGQRRVGDFEDFYPETPTLKASLELDDDGIWAAIPWSSTTEPQAQWFLSSRPELTPAEQENALPLPKRVAFRDSHGALLLIRCSAQGFHTIARGPGFGRLAARAAILDVRQDVPFDLPHGLMTDISGLRAWLGVSAWSVEEDHDPLTDRYTTRVIEVQTPNIEIGAHAGMKLSFRPGAHLTFEDEDARIVAHDTVRCTTESVEAMKWEEHRQVHLGVRDLLVLSRWHSEKCVEKFATRADDPLLTMDGREHGQQWRQVLVGDDREFPQPKGIRPHLVEYADLGAEGVRRWLSIRDNFSRALDPVISSIDLRDPTAQALLANTLPGLEALGYLLMTRDGLSEKAAGRTHLHARLSRILEDLGDCLPFDSALWASSCVATYNGLKHANRTEPDLVDVANAWQRSVLVARAWVAVELGIDRETIRSRLARDPQRHAFEASTA